MMNLWLLVILGFMASVANCSKSCVCPCQLEDNIKKAVDEKKRHICPPIFLPVPGLTSLNCKQDTVTVNANLDSASAPWKINVTAKATIDSAEFKDMEVELNVKADTSLESVGGAVSMKKGPNVAVSVKLLNSPTILISTDPIVAALTGTFKSHCNRVVDIIIEHLNSILKGLKGGITKSRSVILGIETAVDSAVQSGISLTHTVKDVVKNVDLAFENTCPAVPLAAGRKTSICCPQGLVSSVLNLLNWNFKRPIGKNHFDGLFLGVDLGSLHLGVWSKSSPKFLVTKAGSHIGLDLKAEVSSSNLGVIASADVGAKVNANVNVNGGYVGLKIDSNAEPPTVTASPPHASCGCDDTQLKTVLDALLDLFLLDLLLQANCDLDILFPWPAPIGLPQPLPQPYIEPNDGYFSFGY